MDPTGNMTLKCMVTGIQVLLWHLLALQIATTHAQTGPSLPDTGDERIAIARIRPDGELIDDIEGIALYTKPAGKGYLLVSSQDSDTYALYDRWPPHQYRGMFRVRANTTGGIEVSRKPMALM